MNWGKELLDLYEKNEDKVGVIEYRGKMPYVLLPLYHTTAMARITATIDQKGNFINAELVDKDDKMTIIPISDKSASRTSKAKIPHALCDNIKYLAGDYKKYCDDDGERFDLYISQLKQWCSSDICHDKVRAIYTYLKKETLIEDLVKMQILKLDGNGKLDEKEKLQNEPQEKALVRFIIRSGGTSDEPDECWKDQTLQECYINYVRSQEKQKDLCYLSGNMEAVSYLHSKKIRNEGDGAKLISSNDSQNFTYRGRFTDKEEAFAIGYETSQKIHNALKWILRRQGKSYNSLMLVTWESNGADMPEWNADTEQIVSDYEKDLYIFEDEDEPEIDNGEIIAEKFYKALQGYGSKIENTSRMILLGVDAATPGRLSMVEEKALDSARYLGNIKKWHEDCCWVHEKWKDKEKIRFFGMVGVGDVADILFGSENKGYLAITDANSKKIYGEVARRLIPCIWDGRKIPIDYVQRAIWKASSPMGYENRKNWERVLTLACSMVKKSRKEKNDKEEWNVALDHSCTKRDYLYGRLLAVADRIEYRTYDMEKDSSRVTNAKRYMSVFSQRPFETWRVIEENVQPYLNKLSFKERRGYENLLNEICNLFGTEDFTDNKKLDGLYLLGFHSQSYELKNFKAEKEQEE